MDEEHMTEKLQKYEFNQLYELMELSFPKDEYREKADQEKLLDNPVYTVYSQKTDNGGLKAVICAWDFNDFLYIEHFAVHPEHRNGGIGGNMLKEIVAECGKRVCLEVELPNTEMAKRRISFYQRNGFFLNDYPYVQPAMGKGKKAVPLSIMTTEGRLTEGDFEKIRSTLYREVYGCAE